MATNTSKTFLNTKVSAAYTKLVDITSYPDIFTAPPRLDTTTLTDTQRTYIKDIVDVPEMVFEAWYDKTAYTAVKALEGKQTEFQLAFGETGTGSQGTFTWTGDIFCTPLGGGVSGIRGMQITCYPSTAITYA